mmetsp:Transcript_105997/g.265461  ORF Transcript_105997/g.265461 Transcript_105997/m.265461 type:complete len:103 (+) Transcript_105997:133-441(+)
MRLGLDAKIAPVSTNEYSTGIRFGSTPSEKTEVLLGRSAHDVQDTLAGSGDRLLTFAINSAPQAPLHEEAVRGYLTDSSCSELMHPLERTRVLQQDQMVVKR